MEIPEMILISGAGRDTGKTSLATTVIRMLAGKTTIYGIKTSPHFHPGIRQEDIIWDQRPRYVILREHLTETGKDSARMLQAGCKEVFVIFAGDREILTAFQWLYVHYSHPGIWVCESPALSGLISPGLSFFMDSARLPDKDRKPTGTHPKDKVYTFYGDSPLTWKSKLDRILKLWMKTAGINFQGPS